MGVSVEIHQGDEADATTGGVDRKELEIAWHQADVENRHDPQGTFQSLIQIAENGQTDPD